MVDEHRKGLTYSAVMHLLIMAFILFGLPSFLRPEVPPQPLVISVEVLPISEMTNVKASDKPLAKEEKPEPPKPEEKPTPPKPDEPAPPPPPPPPEKKEEKKPDPKKEEPKKEKPKKQEKTLDEILKDLKNEKAKTASADAAKEKPKTEENGTKVKAKNTNYDPGLPMSMSEIDAIRSQITRCWNVPAGAKNADQLQVTLRVQLGQDGTVIQVELADESKSRYSADSFYRAAADSAMRAVRQCSPLKNLSPEKYQTWRDMLLTFDPKEMLF